MHRSKQMHDASSKQSTTENRSPESSWLPPIKTAGCVGIQATTKNIRANLACHGRSVFDGTRVCVLALLASRRNQKKPPHRTAPYRTVPHHTTPTSTQKHKPNTYDGPNKTKRKHWGGTNERTAKEKTGTAPPAHTRYNQIIHRHPTPADIIKSHTTHQGTNERVNEKKSLYDTKRPHPTSNLPPHRAPPSTRGSVAAFLSIKILTNTIKKRFPTAVRMHRNNREGTPNSKSLFLKLLQGACLPA